MSSTTMALPAAIIIMPVTTLLLQLQRPLLSYIGSSARQETSIPASDIFTNFWYIAGSYRMVLPVTGMVKQDEEGTCQVTAIYEDRPAYYTNNLSAIGTDLLAWATVLPVREIILHASGTTVSAMGKLCQLQL